MIKFLVKLLNYIKVKIIKIFVLKSNIGYKQKFKLIYDTNYWASNVSKSGTGSTLDNTQNIRSGLQSVINDYKIRKLLDVPCGDFYWMKEFLNENLNLNYHGGDIVNSLIEDLKKKYETNNRSFSNIDIIRDNLPDADLLFCRDCFMHFSNEDILKSLTNFLNSGIKFIIVSNTIKPKNFKNKNINTGEYREVNLFLPPFNLPKNNLVNLDDMMDIKVGSKQDERKMSMWSRNQILQVISKKNG